MGRGKWAAGEGAESGVSCRAVDSLINYETVKYFNNEKHEVGSE